MNSPLETGLFLPLRFYDTLAEQDRYKVQSEGMALLPENYVHVDCTTLAPFQIVFSQVANNTSIAFKLVCVDTGAETILPYDAAHWEEIIDTALQLIWTSYLGTDDFTGLIGNGKYYLVVSIEDAYPYTRTFYSDVFMISNCVAGAYDTLEYRKWTSSDNDLRLIDATNLRIL